MTSGGREAFGVITPQPVIQNMRLAFSGDGSAVYKPLTNNDTNINTNSPSYQPSAGDGGSLGINVNMSESTKKKRGRPRKYGPDGTMALALVSAPNTVSITHPAGEDGGDFASPTGAAVVATLSPTITTVPSGGSVSPTTGVIKRGRGRPPGSTNKKHRLQSLGSAGFGFTPHVISVKAGEDVSSKIMSFSQHGPRAVCILSANGAISNVTLRQPATSGGTVTYQGRFEILSLSGSFLPSENGGQKSRTGGLSVSLSGQDGRVLGGGVAGLLMAASPVQVIVASFVSDGRKESKLPNHVEPVSGMNRFGPVGGPSSPPSRGTLSESSGSPLHHSANNSNLQGMSSIPWK